MTPTKQKSDPDSPTLREMVFEIHQEMFGNPKYKREGLVQKIERHDKYIRNDKRLKWTIGGIVTAVIFWIQNK